MVWMGRMPGHSQIERVYGPDLLNICEHSVGHGYRHFLFGEVPDRAKSRSITNQSEIRSQMFAPHLDAILKWSC